MRSVLYDAVDEAAGDEFDLVAELGGGAGWAAFLARPAATVGPLAILLLQEAEEEPGHYDLEILSALDADVPVGRTLCASCDEAEAGWPRFCNACGADLSGIDAAGSEEMVEEVRSAARGVYDILGEMPHDEGGGALYFARELASDRVVGLALRHHAEGGFDLVVAWVAEPDATTDAAEEEPAAAPTASANRLEPSFLGDDRRPPASSGPRSGAGRRRDRARRVAGTAAIAMIGLALVTGTVIVWRGNLAGADIPARPIPLPSEGPPTASPRTVGAGEAPVDARAPVPPLVRADPPAPSPASTVEPRAERPSRSAAEPLPVAAEPPPAPTAQGIVDAITAYATAVQSRQTSRVARAYPGITPAEVDRWDRFFRPLGASAGLEARPEILSGPSVQGTRGEAIFTLTLSYADAAGNRVETPLPLRAVLEWTGAGWSLREVRSLQ